MNLIFVVFVGAALSFVSPFVAASEESEYGFLVDKPGVEETHVYCTACHSERIVVQQGLTAAGWTEVLDWMVDEQEMEEIEEPDRTLILKYLSKNYNVERPNFPKK